MQIFTIISIYIDILLIINIHIFFHEKLNKIITTVYNNLN